MRVFALGLATALSLQGIAVAAQSSAVPSTFPRPAKIRVADKDLPAQASDCGDWQRRLAELPQNHKWAEFQQPPRPPLKGEYETTADYEIRLAAYGREFEPVWVNVAFKIDPEALTYDADGGLMSVHYATRKAGLDGSFSKRFAYKGINAFGVTADVTAMNMRSTSAIFEPSTAALPSDLRFAMAPGEARDLKERGIVHVLGVLRRTDGTGGFSGATLTSPTDFSYGHRELRIEPICVAVTVGDKQISQWESVSVPHAPTALTPPVPRQRTFQQALAEYPSQALRQGLQGRVGFRLSVSADGRVANCVIISSSGHPVLDEAACQNVRRYARFEPAKRYGEPVEGQYENAFDYSLPN